MGNSLAILAPSGRDAEVLKSILAAADINSIPFQAIGGVFAAISRGEVGALILAEEALHPQVTSSLENWLIDQPPWSDLPIILMTTRQGTAQTQSLLAQRLGNVTILERPLHPVTLVFSARAALRARARQHTTESYIGELQAERLALSASEARYRTLFETIDEGFCVIEFVDGPQGPLSDYIHVEANAAYTRHAGIPDIVGKRLTEIVSASEANSWAAIYRQVLLTGEPVRFERELKETSRHLELAAFRIEPRDRNQVAVIFQDVTARRQAENAIRQLNETLEARIGAALAERRLLADVIEHTSLFVQIVGSDWRWLAINRAAANEFERIYGVRPAVGDDMRQLLEKMPEHRADVESVWQRALAGEEFTTIGEYGDETRDRRSYEIRFYSLKDVEGRQIGAYQVVSDVTDRLAEQRKLAELQKMDAIGQLTGGVAHDFNNLLAAIISNLEIARKSIDDPRVQKLMDGAMKGAERGASLTRRLLAFARRQDLKSEVVTLHELVDDMRELLTRTIGPSVKLITAVPTALPRVVVDRNQLELAILNLAVNARDAMPDGGELTISAEIAKLPSFDAPSSLPPGRYVRLRVQDEGAGMDAPTIARATEPFFTTKGIGKGTGLGLSMVHGLAQQSNGALTIASEPGVGTTISLWLPEATSEPSPDLAISEQSSTPEEGRQNKSRLKVLVVDDDPLVGMGTAAMLEDLGHTAIEADSGKDALLLMERNPDIDLVVTDHSMPGMTGLQLAQTITEKRPGLPIILASGYADIPGGAAVNLPRLAKPFNQSQLAAIVDEVLGTM